MATDGKWEMVGKPKKVQSSSKIPKKISSDTMPRIDPFPPVEESATIYDALLPKEKKKDGPQRSMVEEVQAGAANGVKAKPKVAKKPNPREKKAVPITLEEAIKTIVSGELEEVVANDQESFPDNRSIWLKDLASVLHLRLINVPMTDPVFADQSADYPLCMLSKKSRSVLQSTLKGCSPEMRSLFLEHCVQAMINDIGKGYNTYAYCMFVQLIVQSEPNMIVNNLPKYLEMLREQTKRPLRALSIMWAVGQVGARSLQMGLKVWLELMVPVLNIRALSGYAVQYLSDLFRMHPDLKSAYGVIDMCAFFPVLDLIFAPPQIPGSQQKTLLSLYPKLKSIVFGAAPQTTLRKLFPSFLVRCVPNCPKMQKEEIFLCLLTCLSTDKQCFSVWRQMYEKQLLPSSVLLDHLLAVWPHTPVPLDRHLLRETLQAFSITGDETPSAIRSTAHSNAATRSAKALLTKMSGSRLPWCSIIMSFLAVVVAVVYYDIYSSKGFKGSVTGRALTDSGLLVLSQQIYSYLQFYWEMVFSWLEVNVPLAYSRLATVIRPYLSLLWVRLWDVGVAIATATAPLRASLARTADRALVTVQDTYPSLLASCLYYASTLWQQALYYTLVAVRFVVVYLLVVWTWLLENVFIGSMSPENLAKMASSTLTAAQAYTLQLQAWAGQLMSGQADK